MSEKLAFLKVSFVGFTVKFLRTENALEMFVYFSTRWSCTLGIDAVANKGMYPMR